QVSQAEFHDATAFDPPMPDLRWHYLIADYLTLPRAATGQTTSTASPRTPQTSSTMLLTTQAWLGMMLITSPIIGFAGEREKSSMPCSSERPATTASRDSTTR